MKALRFHAAKDLRLDTIETPLEASAVGQVLIEIDSSASAVLIFTSMPTGRSSSPLSRIPLQAPASRGFSAMNSAAWWKR